MGTSEGQDGGDTYNNDDYDGIIVEKQILPGRNTFYDAFPKIGTGGMPSRQVYELVGGHMWDAHKSGNPNYQNACAIRISRALNYSGKPISIFKNKKGVQKSEKGADNKYYFLNSKALNLWMRKTFGNPTGTNHITDIQAGQHGVNLPNLLTGKKGIYSLISSDTKWAYGHADFLKPDATCGVYCHFYDAPIDYIDVWILN